MDPIVRQTARTTDALMVQHNVTNCSKTMVSVVRTGSVIQVRTDTIAELQYQHIQQSVLIDSCQRTTWVAVLPIPQVMAKKEEHVD